MSEIDPRLHERLDELCGSRTVVLGVGNTLKGDDGVGPLVCERLAGKISATVIDAGTVPENHIGPIAKVMVRNARKAAPSRAALVAELAGSIERDKDRAEFAAAVEKLMP